MLLSFPTWSQTIDINPPAIESVEVLVSEPGQRHDFRAKVTDDMDVVSVALHFRAQQDNAFASSAMRLVAADNYATRIELPLGDGDLIEYFIEARDSGGNQVLHGSELSPKFRLIHTRDSAASGNSDNEQRLWQRVKRQGLSTDWLRAYLEAYPTGKHAVGVRARLRTIKESGRSQATQAPQSEPRTSTPTGNNRSAPPPSATDALLARIDDNIRARQFTTPANNNANDNLNRLEELDPKNPDIAARRQQIRDTYEAWIRRQIEVGNSIKARQYLDSLGNVPGSQTMVDRLTLEVAGLADKPEESEQSETAQKTVVTPDVLADADGSGAGNEGADQKVPEPPTPEADKAGSDTSTTQSESSPVSLPFEPAMEFIPGGRFLMGSSSGEPNELPVKSVNISPFEMGKHEVTFDQYRAFVRGTGAELPESEGWGEGQRPVINVSWQDANDYAAWLSQRTGKRYRLPTEAEWEWAARGDSETRYFFGDNARELCNYANGSDRRLPCKDNNRKTAQVGSFQANAFGLHDMYGNVAEWVLDCWDRSYSQQHSEKYTTYNLDSCKKSAVRGGAWNSKTYYLRATARQTAVRAFGYETVGFRLARTLE